MGSTSSVGTLYFTGISSYSSDFQSIIQRAVQVAQQPITALQTQQSNNLSMKQALIALNPDVAALGGDVAALGQVASGQSLAASSTDSSIVSVANMGASGPGTYVVSNITSLASAASEMSLTGYADVTTTSVSTNGHVDLVVGSQTYHLDVTNSNNLKGLVAAINGANAGVSASILTATSGDYLSITANQTGATTLQLNDIPASGPGVNLITGTNQGSNAVFTLNGTIHESKASNTVNDIIPGVSFTLNDTTTGSVTLTLTQDASQLSGVLQKFVTDYNKLVGDVAQQTGTSGGPLAGDFLIHTISSDMQHLITYWNPSSSSSIHSLSDLGIGFADNTGQLSFNAATFSTLSGSQITDALKFIGSSTSGFAQLASNFTQLTDPITGMIRDQEDGYDNANTQLASRISTMEQQLSKLQADVTAQMQAADAMVAQLQSTQNTVSASIQSLNYVLYGKTTNANGL